MPAEPSGKGGQRPMRLGKYEILARIGSGGMGTVYRARDTELGRDVAVKVLAPDMAERPVIRERFRREARSADKLRHENIVALYDFGEVNDTRFLAMEYVDGPDLHDYISRRGQLRADEAREILTQAARALSHAHRVGIVHRDIKPSNFLIGEKNGRLLVKLADLGLAREANDDEAQLTRLGATVGTADYIAPEQAVNSRSADVRSDLYSLGCTLYHMLAGQPPFPDGTPSERAIKHIREEPPDVRLYNPAVPADLVTVLNRLLAKKPADRYQTPDDLLRDLQPAPAFTPLTLIPAEPAPAPALAPFGDAPPVRLPPSAGLLAGALPARGAGAVREADPARAPVAVRRRARDTDDEADGETDRTHTGLLAWWRWVVGAAVLLAVAAVVLALVNPSGPRDGAKPDTGQPKQGAGEAGERKERIGLGAPEKKGSPAEMAPAPKGPPPVDLAPLRAAFEGPLAHFPMPPPGAPVLRVSRSATPGPGTFRSLGEAWSAAPAGRHTVIEIRDSGPLFEPAPPAAVGRSLTVRAAPGFRPLIAWEGAGTGADRFLAVENGSLTLEDLDVVMRWTEDRAERPAALLAVRGGNLAARGCTFSVAGKHPRGVEVVRLEPAGEPARCRLSRCFVRGPGLTALALGGAGADVLLDGCLVVSAGDAPLLDVRPRADGACTLRLVRSTLIAGKNLLHVAAPADMAGRPAVNCLCWDSVLARPGPDVEGQMVRVADAAALGRMSWKAVNSVYAGWEKLVASPGREISSADEGAWRATWGGAEAGRVLDQPWPVSPPAGLEETGPETFDPRGTGGFPAASDGSGPVGCALSALPAGRPAWLGLTYERFAAEPPALPGDEGPPLIPSANDGRYHGGQVRLDARTPDLGQFLREQLQGQPPGPRVVLHVWGSGDFRTSPIELRGADLVLYFAKPPAGAKPLTLSPNPRTASGKPALIEVTGGGLEITGARLILENSALAAQPARLVRVQGGPLRLSGCRLQGPLNHAPPDYQGLIEFTGSGQEEPARAHGCALDGCVLLSARALLTVRGTGARLLLQQCALLGLGDALRIEPGEAAGARLNVACSLSRVTVAARRAAVHLADAPKAPAGAEPVVVQADGCLFLDPFADTPRRGTVLVYEGDALARGLLVWQGKGNGYDAGRLQSYAVSEADAKPPCQVYSDWARLWGRAGEQGARRIEWPATAAWTVAPDHPQLERLRLPAGADFPIGADLKRLGILKKR